MIPTQMACCFMAASCSRRASSCSLCAGGLALMLPCAPTCCNVQSLAALRQYGLSNDVQVGIGWVHVLGDLKSELLKVCLYA